MTAVVSQWGNSLAVRIPSHVARSASLQLGDALSWKVSKSGYITMYPEKKQDIDFGALYALITPENRSVEIGTGSAVGHEVVTW